MDGGEPAGEVALAGHREAGPPDTGDERCQRAQARECAHDPNDGRDAAHPGGVRCSVLDLLVNQLGPRPESVWTPQEKAAGRGFGGIPFSNEGVLYGLSALESGAITPAQA